MALLDRIEAERLRRLGSDSASRADEQFRPTWVKRAQEKRLPGKFTSSGSYSMGASKSQS